MPAAGEERIVELHRVEVEVALDLLEPFHRVPRGRLKPQHLHAALVLVFLEGGFERRLGLDVVRQRDGAFERKLGAGTDGEMRGRGGVTHQHDVFKMPALAEHAREIDPGGAADVPRIRHQRMAVQMIAKDPLAGRDRLVLRHLAEAELLPRRLGAFDEKVAVSSSNW